MNEVIVEGVPAYAGCINHPVNRENVRQGVQRRRGRRVQGAACRLREWADGNCRNRAKGRGKEGFGIIEKQRTFSSMDRF